MAAKLTRDYWAKKWPPHYAMPKAAKDLHGWLKEYERVYRKAIPSEALRHLEYVETAIGTARSAAERTFRADPLMKKLVLKTLSEMEALAVARKKEFRAGETTRISVWEGDFKDFVSKSKFLQELGGAQMGAMQLSCTMPKIFWDELQALGADQRLIREFSAIAGDAVKELDASLLKLADSVYILSPGFNARAQVILQSAYQKAQNQIHDAPAQILTRVCKDKRLVKKYRKDKAVSVTRATLNTGIAIAGCFAGGGRMPVAIVLAVRTANGATKEWVRLLRTAQSKHCGLLQSLKFMQQDLARRYTGKSNEVTREVVNAVIGADWLPTLKRIEQDYKDLKGTLALVAARLIKLERQMAKARAELDRYQHEQDVLGERINGLNGRAANSREHQNVLRRQRKADANVVKLQAHLDKVQTKLLELDKRLRPMQKNLEMFRREVKVELLGGNKDLLDVEKCISKATDALIAGLAFGDVTSTVISLDAVLLAAEGLFDIQEEVQAELAKAIN